MLAFGIASRVAGFLWAAFGLRLFRFLGLFMRFGRAGRNVALLAGPLRMLAGAGRIFGRLARSAGWFLASIAPGRIKGALAGLHMLATFGKGTALTTLFTGLRTAAVAALSAIAAAGWPVVLTIGLIAAAVFLLWKYRERFKAFMKGFGDGFYDAFAPDIEWLSGKWESLVSDVRGWVDEIAEITGADAEAAMAAFDRWFDFSGVDAQLARARDAVDNFFSDLFTQEQLGDAEKGEVEAAGRRIGKGLGNAIRSAIANLVTLGALIVEHIIAGLEAAWSDLTDWFSTRFDALGELISFDIDWPEPPSWMKWLAEKAGFVDEPKQSAPSETPAPEPAAPKSDGLLLTVTAHAADIREELKQKKTEHFDDTTLGSMLQKVFGEHGAQIEVDGELSGIEIEYEARRDQSPLDFATRLADRHNAIFKAGGGRFLFVSRGSRKKSSGGSLAPVLITRPECRDWSISGKPRAV